MNTAVTLQEDTVHGGRGAKGHSGDGTGPDDARPAGHGRWGWRNGHLGEQWRTPRPGQANLEEAPGVT